MLISIDLSSVKYPPTERCYRDINRRLIFSAGARLDSMSLIDNQYHVGKKFLKEMKRRVTE